MEWNCDLCGAPTNEIWHYSLPICFLEEDSEKPVRIIKDKDVRICKECREELTEWLLPNYAFSTFVTKEGKERKWYPVYEDGEGKEYGFELD